MCPIWGVRFNIPWLSYLIDEPRELLAHTSTTPSVHSIGVLLRTSKLASSYAGNNEGRESLGFPLIHDPQTPATSWEAEPWLVELSAVTRIGPGIFLFLSIGVFLVVSVGAQKAARPVPPKYDLQTETKIKGTIEEVKLPPKGSEKEIAHLLVKNGADTVDVYLCPKAFMDDMGMEFSKGDEISLTGSKIKQGRC